MSRYIDADEFYVSQTARCWGEPLVGTCTNDNVRLYDELQKFSISDVVEVVRCKDCKFCEDLGMSGMYCKHPDNRNPIGCNPDDYCDCGERKHRREKR